MNRLVTILIIVLLANVGSALAVVYARHDSRNLAKQLGVLEKERDEAVGEWSRLQLEQAYLADAGMVEAKARRELGMIEPVDPAILVIRP